MYAYYRSAVAYQQHMTTTNTALPYILFLLLLGCVVGNMALMVRWKCDRIREKKVEEVLDAKERIAKMQEEENVMFLDEAKRKLSTLTRRTNSAKQEVINPLELNSESPKVLNATSPKKKKAFVEPIEPLEEPIAIESIIHNNKRLTLKDKLL